MALVIPGFAARFDFADLVRCIAPRSLLVVSSDNDPYSSDAEDIVQKARPTFARLSAGDRLAHFRIEGSHALDERRFSFIVNWVTSQSAAP